MRSLRPLLSLVAVLVLASTAAADLRGDVDKAIRASQLASASIAVNVRDATSGVELLDINGSTQMIPASNMKLLTTGTALHVLGADFRFRTRLLSEGDRLIVLGDGDPAFGDPELLELMTREDGGKGLGIEQFMSLWVSAVVDAGVESVSELIVDDRIFDREFVHEGWPRDQLNKRYCAEVSGLNFHTNVLHFFPKPGSGARPDITVYEPRAPWIHPKNSATNRKQAKDSNTVWIARPPGSNTMTFHGNVRYAYRQPVPITVHDMPDFFARLLADRLDRAGVDVGSVRVATLDEPRFTGVDIAPMITTPISTVLTRCNRNSQNLYAEALVKRAGGAMTGQPGSWTNGRAIVRHVVHERLDGRYTSSLSVDDGSGLSRDNRVTAEMMTAWLASFHADEALRDVFVNSLAQPDRDGTLQKRFRGVDTGDCAVHAKSGYINAVSCLSGYVTGPDGRRRCFSVLVNDLTRSGSVAIAKKLQEEIVAAVARDLSREQAVLGSD